jgi:putative transcriptional regulator
VTVVNLSILKNGRAKAIRFSTLTRLCEVLECQPGDLLSVDHRPLAPGEDEPGRATVR